MDCLGERVDGWDRDRSQPMVRGEYTYVLRIRWVTITLMALWLDRQGRTGAIRLLLLFGLGLPLLGWWFFAVEAEAHGGTEYLRRDQGPYNVRVFASPPRPQVGDWHLTLEIRSVDTLDPVNDVNVHIKTRPLDTSSQDSEPLEGARNYSLVNSSLSHGVYDTTLPMISSGLWQIEVFLDGDLGMARFLFNVRVHDTGTSVSTILIWTSLILILIVGSWFGLRLGRSGLSSG